VGRNSTVSWGDPLILSLPGRRTSTRWERRQLKGWACLASSVTGEAAMSVRNGVLLNKQLIRPMMDYACPIWRFAARSHVRKLQVLQSKCIRIATNAPWYVSNKSNARGFGDPILRRPHQSTDRVSTQS
jgi:hypothetical protein